MLLKTPSIIRVPQIDHAEFTNGSHYHKAFVPILQNIDIHRKAKRLPEYVSCCCVPVAPVFENRRLSAESDALELSRHRMLLLWTRRP